MQSAIVGHVSEKSNLSPREAEAWGHVHGGKSPPEAAAAMGCSAGAVWSHVHRAKKKLGMLGTPTPRIVDADVSKVRGCPICGLRGEHECLRGDATARNESA